MSLPSTNSMRMISRDDFKRQLKHTKKLVLELDGLMLTICDQNFIITYFFTLILINYGTS